MKQVLQDYMEYLKLPKWSKQDKLSRHQTMQNWYAKEYQQNITYEDLLAFEKLALDNGFEHYKSYFYFQKIEFDVYYKEIVENRNFEALKHCYYSYGRRLCNREKKIDIDLVDLGLEIKATDEELLKEQYKSKINFLRLTIHEIPWIVIAFNADAASIEDTKKLFKVIDETIELSKKINVEIDEKLINDCMYYWTKWIEFLEEKTEHDFDFQKYLEENESGV